MSKRVSITMLKSEPVAPGKKVEFTAPMNFPSDIKEAGFRNFRLVDGSFFQLRSLKVKRDGKEVSIRKSFMAGDTIEIIAENCSSHFTEPFEASLSIEY